MATQAFVKTTCPRDCYDACGVLVKMTSDGGMSIVGDPDHHMSRGKLCGKCSIAYNGVWRSDSDRLSTPLKRIGPKGSGQFAAVSWDAALGEIAHRRPSHPPDALHRYLLADCRDFPAALLQSRWRDGSRSRLRLQQSGSCSASACLWRIDPRVRPAHDRLKPLRFGLGGKSFGFRAARSRALAAWQRRSQNRSRPDTTCFSGSSGHSSPIVSWD